MKYPQSVEFFLLLALLDGFYLLYIFSIWCSVLYICVFLLPLSLSIAHHMYCFIFFSLSVREFMQQAPTGSRMILWV